jgi:hypothetical protein
MSGVFRNIDPPPPLRPASVYPRLWCGGIVHTRWVEKGWGSIVRKTPDTALYSIYVSTLWIKGPPLPHSYPELEFLKSLWGLGTEEE